MSDFNNLPDAATEGQHVPMLDAEALGDPLRLAAELVRQVSEEPTIYAGNSGIFGGDDGNGPIDEAVAALDEGDLPSARGWLQITIGAAMQPVPKIIKGRDAQGQQLRTEFQRDRALLAARCALHLILPALQGEVIAERLAAIDAPRH